MTLAWHPLRGFGPGGVAPRCGVEQPWAPPNPQSGCGVGREPASGDRMSVGPDPRGSWEPPAASRKLRRCPSAHLSRFWIEPPPVLSSLTRTGRALKPQRPGSVFEFLPLGIHSHQRCQESGHPSKMRLALHDTTRSQAQAALSQALMPPHPQGVQSLDSGSNSIHTIHRPAGWEQECLRPCVITSCPLTSSFNCHLTD